MDDQQTQTCPNCGSDPCACAPVDQSTQPVQGGVPPVIPVTGVPPVPVVGETPVTETNPVSGPVPFGTEPEKAKEDNNNPVGI